MAVTPGNENPPVAEERVPDEALARSTGYRWSEWIALLDARGAADLSRAERAELLKERYGLSLWWANTINVGYERAKADRAAQEPPRAYDIQVSRTFPVTVDRLFAAFVEPAGRERWLGGAGLRVRSARPHRSVRFDWQDGSGHVTASFTNKGEKSAVRVQHRGLQSAEAAEATKRYSRERLTELQHAFRRGATS